MSEKIMTNEELLEEDRPCQTQKGIGYNPCVVVRSHIKANEEIARLRKELEGKGTSGVGGRNASLHNTESVMDRIISKRRK